MTVPEYVPLADVQQACHDLGISDRTGLASPEVTLEEAQVVQQLIGAKAADISAEQFRRGLENELEHGLRFSDAIVSNNHPLLTGRMVLANLKEMLDYYLHLEIAELEDDMLKAQIADDDEKLTILFTKVLAARSELVQAEQAALEA